MQLYNKKRDKKYILVFLIIGLLFIFQSVIKEKLAQETKLLPRPQKLGEPASPPNIK